MACDILSPSQVSSVDRLNGSLSLVRNGIFPQHTPSNAEELSNPRGSWVDVREVASAQVEAIENERAGGERFIVSVGPWSVQDIREYDSHSVSFNDRSYFIGGI